MSDQPSTTNQTATTVNTVISTAGNAGVSVVEAMIIADVPMLGAPVVKQLWEALFGWIAGYFIKAAEKGATFAVIDTQISSEQNQLSKALAELIAAEKSGDKDAIKKAIQHYADAHSALIHYDGSAVPH